MIEQNKQDKRLPTPEETHSMEQLIISAMTNDGEYPVDDVGEHAAQIARVLIFNGYRQETELAKIDKLKLDRPVLRKKIARLVFKVWFSSDLYEFNTVGGEIQYKCYRCADQILALIPDEEEIRRQERERIRAMICVKGLLTTTDKEHGYLITDELWSEIFPQNKQALKGEQ